MLTPLSSFLKNETGIVFKVKAPIGIKFPVSHKPLCSKHDFSVKVMMEHGPGELPRYSWCSTAEPTLNPCSEQSVRHLPLSDLTSQCL